MINTLEYVIVLRLMKAWIELIAFFYFFFYFFL